MDVGPPDILIETYDSDSLSNDIQLRDTNPMIGGIGSYPHSPNELYPRNSIESISSYSSPESYEPPVDIPMLLDLNDEDDDMTMASPKNDMMQMNLLAEIIDDNWQT